MSGNSFPSKKSSCHWRTIPSVPLLRITTFTGMLYCTAVASSWMFIWMLPSPAMSTTSRPGIATCAPIAAGSPYPIVPSPPEERKVRGCS